ncbi:MAG TPA: DUF1330 domain-containing protein [Xanthobacteraceae bacterium]|nr:DUF1330 domain-containing protein [Xanthobacteraceae bacterium]
MPKGYWIPHIDVSNPEGYKAYMAATPPAHEKYAGTALVRGGQCEVVEGGARARNVLREFPDYATALACYRSPEYQGARVFRLQHAQCDFIIAEGYEGPQPPASGSPPAPGTNKGYWIAHIDISDLEGYRPYLAALFTHVGKFGGRYLVRAGAQEVVEGRARSRTAVLEFPSFAAALTCYHSPDYQPVKKLRQGKADVDLVIVEGYDGPKF